MMEEKDLIDGEWHPEAFTEGMQARDMGRPMTDRSANPYLDYGKTHWMLRSFCAGWCDRDQSLLSEKTTYRKVELAASSYPPHMLRGEGRTALTHIAEIGPDGYEPVRLLCRSAKLDSVLPDRSLYGDPSEATCPRCRNGYQRECSGDRTP